MRLLLISMLFIHVAHAQNYGGVWQPLDHLKNGNTARQQQTATQNDIDISELDYANVEKQAKAGDANAMFLAALMVLSGQADGVQLNEDNVKKALLLAAESARRGNKNASAFLDDVKQNGIEHALKQQIRDLPAL